MTRATIPLTAPGWTPDPPASTGWYAIVLHWDGSEIFTGADYWNGRSFGSAAVVLRSVEPLETEEQAQDWALDHNPV